MARLSWPILSFFIMFAAMLGIKAPSQQESQEQEQKSKPPRAKRFTQSQHRNRGATLDAKLEQGERCLLFLRTQCGHDVADAYTRAVLHKFDPQPTDGSAGSQPTAAAKLPYTFWKRYLKEELGVKPTDARRVEHQRAMQCYILRRAAGAETRVGLRYGRRKNSCRSSNAARNAEKARGLGFMLLQYLVDFLQGLRGRSDSKILLSHARALREQLKLEGWAPSQLPKLEGRAGVSWFQRWRRRYSIKYCKTGMKLKVAWRKVLRRVRVELGNVFRFCFVFYCL